jgi:hypothetical protein
MTSLQPVRRVGRNVILGLGLATLALAILTIALPAELLQRFLKPFATGCATTRNPWLGWALASHS